MKTDIKNNIITYIEKNQPYIEWDFRSKLTSEQVINALENGFDSLYDELFELNMDYILNLESELINQIHDEFREVLEKELNTNKEDTIIDYLNENFQEYIQIDYNLKQLPNNQDDLLCLIELYSDYDGCCISTSSIDDPFDYLFDVYKRVEKAIDKKDFLYEFKQVYGSSLFCLGFRMSIENFIKLREEYKKGKQIKIPKGTQFGFFSSFQGSGSMFEKVTKEDLILDINEEINLIADEEQNYSIKKVYGADYTFFNEQNIEII